MMLHRGVSLTMAFIRCEVWIPRLRSLTKRAIKGCFGCKMFQAVAFQKPPPGNLPNDHTSGSVPFQVVGVDYTGPISYKIGKKRGDGKAYNLLFACSLMRAIRLELLTSQTTEEFIKSFKCFIARRGRPQKVYSDNGGSFRCSFKMVKRNNEGREPPWLPGPPPYRMAIQLKQGPLVGRPIREDDRSCKAGLLQVNWGSSSYMG